MGGKKWDDLPLNEMKLSEIWDETVCRFIDEALPFITASLMTDDIKIISAKELAIITEESPGEFLSRDPKNGYWHPEIWAEEVYANFIENQTFYFDKLIKYGQSRA